MQVGDKVRVYGEETEIVATAFDEQGEKVYMLKGYTRDFYEDEIKPTTFELLESIIDLAKEELDKKDKNVNATLGYEELVQLRNLLNRKDDLEIDIESLTCEEKDEPIIESTNYYDKEVENAINKIKKNAKNVALGSVLITLSVFLLLICIIEGDYIVGFTSILWIATAIINMISDWKCIGVYAEMLKTASFINGVDSYRIMVEKASKDE
jgi:hypothetical protein